MTKESIYNARWMKSVPIIIKNFPAYCLHNLKHIEQLHFSSMTSSKKVFLMQKYIQSLLKVSKRMTEGKLGKCNVSVQSC